VTRNPSTRAEIKRPAKRMGKKKGEKAAGRWRTEGGKGVRKIIRNLVSRSGF